MFSCEICESFKNTFFYRTPPVAASEQTQDISLCGEVMFWSFSQYHVKLAN